MTLRWAGGPGVLWAPPRPLLGGREQMQEESKALILLIDAPPDTHLSPAGFSSRDSQNKRGLCYVVTLCVSSLALVPSCLLINSVKSNYACR